METSETNGSQRPMMKTNEHLSKIQLRCRFPWHWLPLAALILLFINRPHLLPCRAVTLIGCADYVDSFTRQPEAADFHLSTEQFGGKQFILEQAFEENMEKN